MRYLKIFIIGFLTILITQFGILVFLETTYFDGNISYSSNKVENSVNKEIVKPKLILENKSKSIASSYDGKYLAYLNNNNLFILNLDNADKIKVIVNEGMEILYFKWIYDRSRLILAERPINPSKGSFLKLYYYDVMSKIKAEVFNEVSNRSIKIPIHNSNVKVDSIDMSTLTNLIYVKMSSLNNYSEIYSINIMAQEKSINVVTNDIGKIISTKRDNILVYENSSNKTVFRQGNILPTEIEGNSNLRLLGIDNKDNIYLALTNNDKTNLIYYGNISNEIWKKVQINTTVDLNNIYVNFNGKIFIRDSSKSIIKELSTGTETYYNGKIIDIYDNGIISENNNEISRTMF